MVDFKKFSSINIYTLIGVEIDATEAEVRKQNLIIMINVFFFNFKYFRFENRIARKLCSVIQIKILTIQKPLSFFINFKRH